MRRALDWLVFLLERLLLRGAHTRLLVMAGSVLAVAVIGGLALTAIGGEEPLADAIWWAFLRLTDPGYLGDDQGLARRALSTVLTIAGYVLFMGALIAILTQWLHATVAWLQRGETPLALRGHLVVLGLTPRTAIVVQELVRSEARVRRLLSLGRRRLRVVVLVEHLDEDVRASLATALGSAWDDTRVILRSGSPLLEAHLDRVDVSHAAAILVPGAEDPSGTAAERDALTLKTVLSLAHHPGLTAEGSAPRIVAEIADSRLLSVVREAYPGSLVLLPTHTLVARLLAQNLRHPGLSWVLNELLAYRTGHDLFFHSFPAAVGRPLREVLLGVTGGVCIGLVRPRGDGFVPILGAAEDTVVGAADRLIVVAPAWEGLDFDGEVTAPARLEAPPLPRHPDTRRVLVLGWGMHTRLLLDELERYRQESFEVDVVSVRPVEERMDELGTAPRRVRIRHLVGDYVDLQDVRDQDLAAYDNLVLLGRDWLEAGAEADAQTLLGALIVRSELASAPRRPQVLVELTDPDNVRLFEDRPGEVLLSPEVMGRVLAHTAVRPEVRSVLGELFSPGGAELHFREPADYGLDGQTLAFEAIRHAGLARGEIVLGVRTSEAALDVRGDLHTAPPDESVHTLDDTTLLLVIAREPGPERA